MQRSVSSASSGCCKTVLYDGPFHALVLTAKKRLPHLARAARSKNRPMWSHLDAAVAS